MIETQRQQRASQVLRDHLIEHHGVVTVEAESAIADAVETATTVKITQDVIDAFNCADFTGCGTADWDDSHVHIGLTAALTALGFEIVQ